MAKEEMLRFDGIVTELLPSTTFRVRLTNNDHMIIAYLGGKLRKNTINILMGDKVQIEMSPYDMSKGRIVYRN